MGLFLSLIFSVLIISNGLVYLKLDATSSFLVRGFVTLFFFVVVIYFSPNIIQIFDLGGTGLQSSIARLFSITAGALIGRGALALQFQGGSSAEDLIFLTLMYFTSIFLIAQPIARTAKMFRRMGSEDRLEKEEFGLEKFETWLKKKEERVNDQKGKIIEKRLKDSLVYLIDSDKKIGLLAGRKTHTNGKKWVEDEILEFAIRNKKSLPDRLVRRNNSEISFKSIDINSYIRSESWIKRHFRFRLLINVAMGTEAFLGANQEFIPDREAGIKSHIARNLISYLDLEILFRDQRMTASTGKEILKRQMLIFLHIFSEIFAKKVDSGSAKKAMAMEEGQMVIRGLVQHLIEKNREISEDAVNMLDYYNEIEIPSSMKIGNGTIKDINNLLDRVPVLDLGISRLDHSPDQSKSDENEHLLGEFVNSSLDFFQGGTAQEGE